MIKGMKTSITKIHMIKTVRKVKIMIIIKKGIKMKMTVVQKEKMKIQRMVN